jgi:potassium/chloride transporter 8
MKIKYKINIYFFQRNSSMESNGFIDSSPSIEDNNSVTSQIQKKVHIHGKLGNWYSPFCNRWFSLLGVSIIFSFN